jgi:PAS domain S-box-containing protein
MEPADPGNLEILRPVTDLSSARSLGPSAEGLPGDVEKALLDVNVPTYAIDRSGVIRWLNPAARMLVGDVQGRQFTSVVAPEDTREARELFMRKVLGQVRSTDADVVLIGRHGQRIEVEVSSAPLRDQGRIVGVFGIVTQQLPTPPAPHPHLTPRQSQILHLLAHGRSTAQIAAELHIAVETVRNHVRRLLRALGAHSRLEAIAVARRDGLL